VLLFDTGAVLIGVRYGPEFLIRGGSGEEDQDCLWCEEGAMTFTRSTAGSGCKEAQTRGYQEVKLEEMGL
jgi:hypothetical protein